MSSGDLIPKSGLFCAVANCKQHSGNAIEEGYNVSFHKFPEDLQLQKMWAQKCKIVGKWNPQSYVCSMHFSPDGFAQDLKAELSGYVPSYRHLRQNVIPTLNLQIDSEKTSTKCSGSVDPKTAQNVRDIFNKAFPPSFSSGSVFLLAPETSSISLRNEDTVLQQDISTTTNYIKLYNDILNECNILKEENKLLKKKEKKQKYWNRDEIVRAFTLIYHSKKAYAYLKNELHYSLPGIIFIQRWAKSINMRKGIIEDVLKIMKLKGDNIEDHEKLTVLMFDEIHICNKIEYDVLNDEIVGPYSKMLVVMAQGISSKWKQPISVDFDVNMTKNILYNIIDKLDDIGYKVVCCVTNCNGKNIELWNQLGTTYENPTFFIPNGRKIVLIPDSFHLLKLTRNWFLDTGFCLNEAEINKKPLEALIAKVSSETGLCCKLKKEHLTCKGPQRENIKLAKQLLSHSTATALQHYRPTEDFQLLDDTSEFIKLISDFFDFTNISQISNNAVSRSPFGMYLYEQNKLLNEVYNIINFLRCKGSNYTNLQMFQKCILMYINGIKVLYEIIKENGVDYLLTAKINKNAIDNLLHQLCFTDNLPSALNAVDRLRMIILGKYPSNINKKNTKDDNCEEYIVAQALKLAGINLSDEHSDQEDSEGSDTDTTNENEFIVINKDKKKKEMELNAIEYLAGWVALKYKSGIPEIGYTTACSKSNISSGQNMMPSWMNHLSYDRSIIPSNDFKKMILRVEWLFNKFTKRKNPQGSDVISKLSNKIFSRMSVEKKYKGAIQSYIKQRIIIRMKYFNYCIQLRKQKKKSKN